MKRATGTSTRQFVWIETDHELHSTGSFPSLVLVVEEGQRLIEQCRPLFSHDPVSRFRPQAESRATPRYNTTGSRNTERTIQNPDPKAGLTPGSPSTMTRGRTVGVGGIWRSAIIGRLLRSAQVDLDSEQRDRIVIGSLPDDDHCVHETATSDEVAVVISLRVEAQQLIESFGERFGKNRELDQQEVARRRLSVGAACLAQLSVEFGKELSVDANRTSGHWRAWRPSVATIRASALRLARSIRSAGTLAGSFTNPARMVAARSSGVIASSSAADQIRSTSICGTVSARPSARSHR